MDLQIRTYRSGDQKEIIALWTRCGLVKAQNNPQLDIERKQSVQPELFFVAEFKVAKTAQIVATLMAGYEGHRAWLNYLAVDPTYQKQGIARTLVAHAETALLNMQAAKINLQIRDTNTAVIAFYKKLGYSIDPVVSMGKRLIPD